MLRDFKQFDINVYKNFFSKDEKVLASWLVFIKSGFFVIVTTYANTLFLSAYPLKYLPAFYSVQAFFEALFTLLLLPFIKTRTKILSLVLINLMFFITISFLIAMLTFDTYWLAFAFSIFLIVCDNIIFLMMWNTIRLAFDPITFKNLMSYLRFSGYTGSIFFGLSIIFIMQIFGYKILPWFIIFLLIPFFICFLYFEPLKNNKKLPKHGNFPFKYDIFRKVFIYVLLFGLTSILVDYCLKFKLSTMLDSQRIADFMAMYIAITQVITGVVSSFLLMYFIRNFSVNYLLVVLPTYWIITASVVMLHPGLEVIAVMAAGTSLLPLTNSGVELILSILPHTVQISGRFLMQLFVLLCIAITIPLIFLFIPEKILLINFILFSFCIILCYIAYLIKFSYLATLKEEIQHKRFSSQAHNQNSLVKTSKVVNLAMKSSNHDFIQFGLSLLSQSPAISYDNISRHIRSKYSDIRLEAIKTILSSHNAEMLPTLLDQFLIEPDDEIKFWLYCAISKYKSKWLFENTEIDINSKKLSVKAGSIIALLNTLAHDEQSNVIKKLNAMATDDSAEVRKYAAFILQCVPFINDEIFTLLIQDDDDQVSIAAIHGAIEHRRKQLVPLIINKFTQKNVYFTEFKKLTVFGESIIPEIMQAIEDNKSYSKYIFSPFLKLLALIPGDVAEGLLLNFCADKNIVLRSLAAREIAHRVKIGTIVSDSFEQRLVAILEDENSLIEILHGAMPKQSVMTKHQKILALELGSRIGMAEERFLYYIIATTNLFEILELMPAILYGDKIERAKGLELLISYCKDCNYTKMFENIFINQPSTSSVDLHDTKDDWLNTILLQTSKGQIMDKIEKIFTLRSTELFRKLPAEILLLISEDAVPIEVRKGRTIFSQGDLPNGLYLIGSGEVDIIKDGLLITTFSRCDFFGELGLLDNEPRTASAVAKTDVELLFIDNDTFERLTEDAPEVLRSITNVVLKYLRSYIAKSKKII